MADHSLIETIVSGVLTGGTAASGAVLGIFRETRRRIENLEAKVGSTEDKKGVLHAVQLLSETLHKFEESLRTLRNDLNYLYENPPEWAQALRRRGSSINLEVQAEFEQKVNGQVRDLYKKFEDVSADLSKLTRKIGTLEETIRENDSGRARELSTIRESIAAINGLLRGLQSILDSPRIDKH